MIRHVASIAEIVEDVDAAVRFYRDVMGLDVQHEEALGYALVSIPGVLHFGIWSRRSAAKSTLGDPDAADQIPLGFTVGFEVDDVSAASKALGDGGVNVVQPLKEEPWGQTVGRFFSPSDALCEVSATPDARRIVQELKAES
jgi:lactoylglutathione lyase